VFLASCAQETPTQYPSVPLEHVGKPPTVENECAIHPERCQDFESYDDSDLPYDPCRDYGDCDFDDYSDSPPYREVVGKNWTVL